MSTILTDMPDHNFRVTFVAQNYAPEPSGNAPYTTDLAEGLVQAGWDVSVVTGYPYYPQWRVMDGYKRRHGTEHINGVRLARRRSYIPRRPTLLKRVVMEVSFGLASLKEPWNSPDIVVLVSPSLFAVWLAEFKAKLMPARPAVIVWVQDLYSKGASEAASVGSLGVRLISAVERSSLRRADRVVAIHDRFKENIVANLRIDPHRISVVRNWTHIRPTELDRQFYRAKFGWRDDEIIVLHAGNMGAKQGLENVVASAFLADEQQAPVRFVLLGGGNQRARLVKMAEGAQRLDFMDSLDDRDFQGAMAGADILLVNETQGVREMSVPSKLTSYFAARRPVLAATDFGSITADEIARAGAGVRVDTNAPDQMLEQALVIGSDSRLADELGSRGAKYQLIELDRQNAIDRYASILAEVLGHSESLAQTQRSTGPTDA